MTARAARGRERADGVGDGCDVACSAAVEAAGHARGQACSRRSSLEPAQRGVARVVVVVVVQRLEPVRGGDGHPAAAVQVALRRVRPPVLQPARVRAGAPRAALLPRPLHGEGSREN